MLNRTSRKFASAIFRAPFIVSATFQVPIHILLMGDLSAKRVEFRPTTPVHCCVDYTGPSKKKLLTFAKNSKVGISLCITSLRVIMKSWYQRTKFSGTRSKSLSPTLFLFWEPPEGKTRPSFSICVLTFTFWSHSAWKSILSSVALQKVPQAMAAVSY